MKWIRGNIDTRLRKLKEEDYDAIILATAGLQRMGWDNEVITEHLDETLCVPAVGQGALAIECREDDKDLLQLLAHMNDGVTEKQWQQNAYFFINLKGMPSSDRWICNSYGKRCNRINSSCRVYGRFCFIERESSRN